MTQICDYSSLIFALNTTVLLIAALTTDYWEYRGLDMNKIIPQLMESRDMTLFVPYDTTSYFQVSYKRQITLNSSAGVTFGVIETYHAPLFLKTRFINVTMDTGDTMDIERGLNETATSGDVDKMAESEFNLFQQYGNLFRDCDALEDIESAACATALLCIVSVCLGSCCGAYGLFVRFPCFSAYHVASCFSLVAGFLLTLCIALFHGKCYLLRKLEIMPDQDLPFRAQLNDARLYSYGWSFSLAWICVFFCYISSYVWLSKSQGSRRPLIRWPQSRKFEFEFLSYTDSGEDEILDIATV